jgi:hypothetical protein
MNELDFQPQSGDPDQRVFRKQTSNARIAKVLSQRCRSIRLKSKSATIVDIQFQKEEVILDPVFA